MNKMEMINELQQIKDNMLAKYVKNIKKMHESEDK